MKTCRVCGAEKPVQEFRKGHRRCNACTADYLREYRRDNAERLKQQEREWYRANAEYKKAYAKERIMEDRAAYNERRREWYRANVETERKRFRERYWTKPEPRRRAAREWAKANPEAACARSHKRRARVAAEVDADDLAYIEVLRSDPCSYCGAEAGSIDHIEPLKSGGSCGWENLTASCRGCNSSKYTAPLLAFLTRAS